MAEGSPAPASRGRKPVPTYYYAIGAAGIAVVYFLYSRNKAAKAAATVAATPSATAVAPAGAGSYGNANDLSALLPYLQGQGNAPNASTNSQNLTAGVGYTAPVGETLTPGSAGFSAPTGGGPVTDANGNTFVYVGSPSQLQGIFASGGQAFIQNLPGVFSPVSREYLQTSGIQAPIFTQAPQGYNYGVK